MAIVNKILKGAIVQQDFETNCFYTLPETGINSVQNALSSANFEEVFITCFPNFESSQATLLPKISSFRRGFSPKIYVTNKGLGVAKLIAYQNEDELNTVNYQQIVYLQPNQSAYLHIVNNYNWACWVTPLAV